LTKKKSSTSVNKTPVASCAANCAPDSRPEPMAPPLSRIRSSTWSIWSCTCASVMPSGRSAT
jgi:hypothetical protein